MPLFDEFEIIAADIYSRPPTAKPLVPKVKRAYQNVDIVENIRSEINTLRQYSKLSDAKHNALVNTDDLFELNDYYKHLLQISKDAR